ncbi:MAG: prohibitin family protein [Leptolyngbyaceae cyanobacterium CSU_1_3]|nr:prohibitin family protein [Leptolyngbyaceae cyanobacterium CSU_1_3]
MYRVNSFAVKPYLFGGAIVLVSYFLLNSFALINAGERGVVMIFGKVQDNILDEGLHFKIPLVTSIRPLTVRVQKTEISATAGTKDLQTLDIVLALNWHIEPSQVNKIFQRVGDEAQIVEQIIKPAITESLKASTPKRTAEEILKQRSDLKDEIDQQIKNRLQTYGLVVDDVSLLNISFSAEFTKSIEAKQIAEQEAKQAEFIALKATKEAEAEVNRAKGQAEAQRLLRQNLTAELLQKQAIDKWNGQFPTVMGGNGALPLINLAPPKP